MRSSRRSRRSSSRAPEKGRIEVREGQMVGLGRDNVGGPPSARGQAKGGSWTAGQTWPGTA